MLTKTITPIIGEKHKDHYVEIHGTKIEYRIFGILLCRKTLHNPMYYGIAQWDCYRWDF